MDRHVEEALLRTGALEACAVLARDVGGRTVRIAYVVPRSQVAFSARDLRRQVVDAMGSDRAPDWFVEIRRMPLTSDGRIDTAALAELEVLDDDVTRRWEVAWRALPQVRDVAVVAEDVPVASRVLHLSDLVPGWSDGGSDETGASGDSRPAESSETLARPLALADGGPLQLPENAPATLVEGLLRTAAEHGDRRIRLIQADGSEAALTYADLLSGARRVLAGLRRVGMTAGDTAILQLPDLADHFPTFWACLLGGIKPVTVAVPTSYDGKNAVVRKLFNTWKLLERPRIIAARRLVGGIRGLEAELGMDGVSVLPVDDLRHDPPAFDHHPSRPEDVAFFQLSSGSTGISKCIQITHRGVVNHIHGSQQHLGLSSDDVTLNWLPMDHVVPLLMYHTKDVYMAVEQVQVPGNVVLGNPLTWLDYIEAYRVTHSWAPNFGFKMVADALAGAKDRRWDLSSLKGLVNAGEQVTLPVVREFLERVAPFGVAPTVMQPAFGMAEACTCMTYDHRFDLEGSVHRLSKSSLQSALRPAAGDEPSVTFVDCGPVVRGVQIRIANTSNETLREGTIGRLQIKGPVITPGYLNNPAANEEAMVGDGWFNTGDLGFIWHGRLTITGREKELIIVNGANFYCYEIEDVASDVPGVLPTFTAACGVADPATGTEALAFFFVHDTSAGVDLSDVVKTLRTEIASRAGLSPAYVVPVEWEEFPKTTSGKIQRGQLKQWLLEGRFRRVLKDLDISLRNSNTVPDWFYRVQWRRKVHANDAVFRMPGVRLVLSDRQGLGAALAALSSVTPDAFPTVLVAPGTAWRQIAPDRYEIDPASPEDYRALVQHVVEQSGPIGTVVHLWTCDGRPSVEPGELESALRGGVYSVLSLVQALSVVQPERPTRLVVVSSGAHAVTETDLVVPAHAALTGLLKTLPAEVAGLECRHIDIEPGSSAQHAALIAVECDAVAFDREVAYREGARWVSCVERLDLPHAPTAPPPFLHGGVYLLTGGLGGIGTGLAKYLLSRFEAKLLIVGRTPLDLSPEPGEGPEGAGDGDVRASLWRELQTLPGDVSYVDADVADEARVRHAVSEAVVRWGRELDGVVHLAGVFAEHPIVDETVEQVAATLRPKVHGAAVLHRLVADRPGALFLTFSSAYGFFGGFAAGAYATANAFLDGLVHWQRRTSPVRARCIAWSLWDGVGMGSGYNHEEAARARGFRLISRRQGLDSLVAVLHRDVPHAVVGLDENGRAIRSAIEAPHIAARRLSAYCVTAPGTDVRALASSQGVSDVLGHHTTCACRQVDALPHTGTGDVDIRALVTSGRRGSAARVTPRTEIEQVVAAVWQEALKQEGLSVHDNFFELGGTSFLAGQIAGRLRARLQMDVVSTQMFQFPTIAAQAAFLTGDTSSGLAAVASSQSRGATRRKAARRQRPGASRRRAE